jgi:ATP-dependent Zn protease
MAEKQVEGWSRWEPCDSATGEQVLARLARNEPRLFATSSYVAAQRAALSFYSEHELIEVDLAHDVGVARVFVLHGPRDTYRLDGESAPIYAVNDVEDFNLNDGTVADYLRFFLYFLRTELGAFVLVESPNDVVDVPSVEVAPTEALDVDAVKGLAQPLAARDRDGDRWCFDGTVVYDGAAFHASFAVNSDGLVEMIDDEAVGVLGAVGVLEPPRLEFSAPSSPDHPSGRAVTQAVVAVLLEDAVRDLNASGSERYTLLRHFNVGTQSDTVLSPIEQLQKMVEGSKPVVVIESEVPFVEDFVAALVAPDATGGVVARCTSVAGDDLRCSVDVVDGVSLYLLSFHAYRGLFDVERAAHELSVSDATVLVGANRIADVPKPLQQMADLVITFPQIDNRRFERIFERVFGVVPRQGWNGSGADWTRYLVPADFHMPRQLGLDADAALDFLRDRVESRLASLSAVAGPRLDELQGMGEARQIAEDLISDIRAAQAGAIPWSAVDRGLLLIGAPGTGKTTLARAIAKECGVKFVVASAASWQSAGYLDAHLRTMRADFDEARRYAPSILFLDEIDSIGSREHLEGSSVQYQTEVINALLEEIQGIDATNSVIIIGATNYLDKVDPALRRAGRLDQVVPIPLPNIEGLDRIFSYHLAQYHEDGGKLGSDVDTRALAQLAFGLTGADVEFFVRGAARRARRAGHALGQAELVAEVTRRPRRPDSAPRLGPDEMRRVAVHEAGHAVAQLTSSTGGAELSFATIIPRMDGTLGFVAHVPVDTQILMGRTFIEQIETALAGRAAEELVFGADDVGTGAGGSVGSDLEVATRLATMLVCQSGLGGSGNLQWTSSPTPDQQREVGELLRKNYGEIVGRLRSNRDLLDHVADALVGSQELDGDELRSLAKGFAASCDS